VNGRENPRINVAGVTRPCNCANEPPQARRSKPRASAPSSSAVARSRLSECRYAQMGLEARRDPLWVHAPLTFCQLCAETRRATAQFERRRRIWRCKSCMNTGTPPTKPPSFFSAVPFTNRAGHECAGIMSPAEQSVYTTAAIELSKLHQAASIRVFFVVV